MNVYVHCGGNLRVSEEMLDFLRLETCTEQAGGIFMPELMPVDLAVVDVLPL